MSVQESHGGNKAGGKRKGSRPSPDDSTRFSFSGKFSARLTVAIVGLIEMPRLLPEGLAGVCLYLLAVLFIMTLFGAPHPWRPFGKKLLTAIWKEFGPNPRTVASSSPAGYVSPAAPTPQDISWKTEGPRQTDWEPDPVESEELETTRDTGLNSNAS